MILLKMDLNALIWTNVQCLHVMMDSDVIIHMAVLHVSTLMNVDKVFVQMGFVEIRQGNSLKKLALLYLAKLNNHLLTQFVSHFEPNL